MSATATVSKWDFRVTLRNDTLTVNSPSGSKTVTLSVPAARKAPLTIKQASLLNHLCKQAGDSISPVTVTLTRDECVTLTGIRDKASRPQTTQTDKALQTTAATIVSRFGDRASAKGSTAEDRQVNRLEGAIKLLKAGGLNIFTYRIPKHLNAECPNPSNLLWGFGFRIDWSGWVIPDASVQNPRFQGLIEHWRKYPALEHHVIPQDPRMTAYFIQWAQDSIDARLREIHTSFLTRLDALAERIATARHALEQQAEQIGTSRADMESLDQKQRSGRRAIIQATADNLESVLECARLFDDTGRTQDLFGAIWALVRAEMTSYNLAAEQTGHKPIDRDL